MVLPACFLTLEESTYIQYGNENTNAFGSLPILSYPPPTMLRVFAQSYAADSDLRFSLTNSKS